MRRETGAQIVIGTLVAGAVILGLLATGGPQAGQSEKRDRGRIDDLRALSDFVRCVAHANNRQLPESLTPDPACSTDVRFDDPHTGSPYRYEKTSANTYRICVELEKPDALRSTHVVNGRLEASTGCATITYR
ncbi:hypothetical protein [uncultured Aliiroseovarius sp.]|jgi:hypothetical protein|uniref:hypothetical protein n=1 Tax=uncultured Aliiroseovarius sp. TaxID=1658783 RepID=UPI00260F1292|nr:hypothetical protein [uncultured Aliiroseovarius sp.]